MHYRGPRRRREKGSEKIFQEIIGENFPNMGKETVTQVLEAQRVPYSIKPRRNMPRHVLIKMAKNKDKDRILKAAMESNKLNTREFP